MSNGDPRITTLVQNVLETNDLLDDQEEIQHGTKFTARFGPVRAHILVYNTGSIVVQGRWSPLATWLQQVKAGINANRQIPAFEPPID
jgi:hypothetical protein